MNNSFYKNISSEKKMFLTFLAINLIVWSSIGLIRTVLPTDSLEGIYWGSLHDFGTPKHPPLAGWITYFTYNIFKIDYSIYFVSQLFVLIGSIYIYKLAKFFLNDVNAMLSVIVLEGCWVYSYITGYYGFNPDVVLLGMLPIITYYFYKCMNENKWRHWIILGFLVGISFLNKYQTGMVIISMAVYASIFNRAVFNNIKFYTSVIIAFFIFIPHLLWLIKYDFFPFMYFDGELTANSWYNHVTAPLMFFIMQFALVIGVFSIFALMKFVHKSSFKLIKNYNRKDLWFILIIGFLPNIIHLLIGFIEGGTMRPRWGFEFWYMFGIMLFYFFPTVITKKEFVFTLKIAYGAMLIAFITLGTLLSVEKNYRSRYPVNTIYNDMQKVWAQKYNTPLKYIGGYIEWTLPLTIYGESHPDCILDTFGYKNPWIDEDDLRKSGIFILDRTQEEVIKQTKKSCPYLPEKYEIKPFKYKFYVTNAFKQPREYTIYYFIVPPELLS